MKLIVSLDLSKILVTWSLLLISIILKLKKLITSYMQYKVSKICKFYMIPYTFLSHLKYSIFSTKVIDLYILKIRSNFMWT